MNAFQQKAVEYIRGLFRAYPDSTLLYHNLAHTEKVAEHASEIMHHVNISESDRWVVYMAAWFHDIGHLFTHMKDHEEKSVEEMRSYLAQNDISDLLIQQIAACIMATRFPANPANLMEQIICDADTFHLGTPEFLITDEMVKTELSLRENIIVDDWNRKTLHFLEHHHFFTAYCREKLNPGKEQNIAILRERIFNNRQS